MKTTYTDEQLQVAIDAAFPAGNKPRGVHALDIYVNQEYWPREALCRLAIAKAFLEKLEADPYAELKKAHAEGKVIELSTGGRWIPTGSEPSWIYPPEEYRIKPDTDTFEAHGKTWTRHTLGTTPDIDGNALVIILSENNHTLNPLKAKDWNWEGGSIIGWRYADAPQTNPVPDPAQDVWTPAVGDVVRLKSPSPKMTVIYYDESDDGFWCAWFHKDGRKDQALFPTACLIKEDAQ